jgi:chemotaxis protein CheX
MMVTKTQITDELVQNCITRSVQSVFKTMARADVAFIEQKAADTSLTAAQPCEIIGSVGFLGDANGLIYICLSEEFAKIASSRVLSMSPAEVEAHGNEVIHDAIGEITNMIVGGFKNTLCDLGFPCKLTLPAIVRGHKLTIATIKAATRHVYHFDCLGHRLIADIQIKID